MSRKHNTNTKIRIILKLEKRVMIMNSSMFLWHMQPICFIDFQKGGILIKGGNDLKRRGLGTLSELCSFIHLTHHDHCCHHYKNQSIDLHCKTIDCFLYDGILVVKDLKVRIRDKYGPPVFNIQRVYVGNLDLTFWLEQYFWTFRYVCFSEK